MRHSSEQFSEGTRSSERGNAIVEFVGVMAVLVVPAVIALLAVSALLMGQSALTAAARESTRAFVRADTTVQAHSRAQTFAQQALDSRGVDSAAIVSVSCSAHPCLTPGATVTITVEADIEVPYLTTMRLSRQATLPVDEYRALRE